MNFDQNRPHGGRIWLRITQAAVALCTSCVLLPFAIAADLSGVVQKGGRPAGGVSIKLEPVRPPATGPSRTATTDQSGHYKFTGLIPGEYTLICAGRSLNAPVRDRAENRVDCDL
jgi:hypothetical protein